MRHVAIVLASFLVAAGTATPAFAGRVCSNLLSDGRIIVQGPLVDSFGAACSRAVLLPRFGLGAQPLIVGAAGFRERVIVLGPRERGMRRSIVIVEPPLVTVPRIVAPGVTFFVPRFGSPFVTTGGRFTTGSLAPFTTFSNSGAILAPSLSLAAPQQRVIVGVPGALVGRRR
jgi:hypothetical protein